MSLIKIRLFLGTYPIWGDGKGITFTTDNKAFIVDWLSKVKTLFHLVFYRRMNAPWHSLLIGGIILFLICNKLHFTVDVFQDLWLGSTVYFVLSVFCQVLYLLIFRISTDGDSFRRLDEQLKCCLVALCQCICCAHFLLTTNKPHSLLLPYFPLWEFRNRNIHSSWLLWGMSHREDVTSCLVNIHQS